MCLCVDEEAGGREEELVYLCRSCCYVGFHTNLGDVKLFFDV